MSSTPKRSRTLPAISRASATSSAVVPPPRFVSASVCLAEIAIPCGSPWPRWKPARSMSHAADVFTRPSASGNAGGAAPSPRRSATRRSSAANDSASRIGFVKKDPALTESGSAGSITMPFPRRSASTAERTSPSGARSPSSTPSARASSAYRIGAERPERSSANVTARTTQRPGTRLNTLERYVNPQAAASSSSTAPVERSSARTDTIVSATSWPYAPTFWIGVAPTEPGMPDRYSTPARSSATQRATSGSHGSPACTSSRTRPSGMSAVPMPRVAIRRTVPGKPASATTTLLPPASTRRGSPASSARRTTSTTASSSVASRSRPAGPPRRRVVRSARSVEPSWRRGYDAARQGPGAPGRTLHWMRRPPVPPPRLRRPPLRALAGFLCVIGVLAGAWLWLRDSRRVAVGRVPVPGVSAPAAPRVREALESAARDMTTLHVRNGELRTAVDPYPGVLGVRTDADFPHGLRIVVHERNPVGTVVAGEQRVPVAADGTLMRTATSAGLPEIAAKALPGGAHASDPQVKRAIAVLAAAPPALRARVRRVYVAERGWTLPLRDGPTLYFGGSERLAAKWVAAATVLADPSSAGAAYLDLRLPERPAAGGLEAPPAEAQQAAPPAAGTGTTAPEATTTAPTTVTGP